MSSGRKPSSFPGAGEAEVEELLRAAQDDLLLNLSVNSHSVSSSFDPDLSRRFQALKSSNSVKTSSNSSKPLPDKLISKGETVSDEMKKILGEDLATRFAKLKGGTGSSNAVEIESNTKAIEIDSNNHNSVNTDEVEKLMQWAMDAARLDPSSNDYDEKIEDENEKIDDSSDEDEALEKRSKEKEKGSKKKWFLF